MSNKTTTPDTAASIAIITEESLADRIYELRGQKVMLDYDLAEIYGYETKNFNRQVNNNIERFQGEEFRFQLTRSEAENLRCKNFTSSWGGSRYLPYAFTEQGIYMLMTVLKGDLAIRQSRALIKAFKDMKNFIIENQSMVGEHEFLRLSLQVADNINELMIMRNELTDLDDKMKCVMDHLSNVVLRSEIAPVLLDMGKPAEKREYLILNGEPARASETYINIYSQASKSITIVDNYVNIKTLRLLQDVQKGVSVTIITDNTGNGLHKDDIDDFRTEFPEIDVQFRSANGSFHDRFILIDENTSHERLYHCGASSKDAGRFRTTVITELKEPYVKDAIRNKLSKLMNNPEMTFR